MNDEAGDSSHLAPLLAFGAHPDDIEFGCGGVIFKETRAGRAAHFVICSRGESATSGTPEQRIRESHEAARILGATAEFIELDGDAHLEIRIAHTIAIARIIRRIKPHIVLAPTPDENQHPDHWRLSTIVRDACRIARYGGFAELRDTPPHAVGRLFFYSVTSEVESTAKPILVDVSSPAVLDAWKRSMQAHGSQGATRNYVEHQLTRARLLGLRAGVEHAIALYPNDPLLIDSLSQLGRGARQF